MRFKRVNVPAHTEWSLTRVRGDRRDNWYNGRTYRRREDAQAEADRINAGRDPTRYGLIIVERRDVPESEALSGVLRF